MLNMWALGVLLLQVALASAGMPTCREYDDHAYPVVTCGAPGTTGQPGINGIDGQNGSKGDPGLPGVAGSPGAGGRQGASGLKGEKGDSGPTGPLGQRGPMGDQGTPGLKGVKGDSVASDPDVIKAQMAALVEQVQDLQSSLAQQKKVLNFFKKTVAIGGKLYSAPGASTDNAGAAAICANAGGSLAMPHNASENNAILSICNYFGANAYLGINFIPTQGLFRYVTGEAVTFTSWAPSEPNNLATEFCVEMYNTGKWNNKPCEKSSLVVCEF